LIISTYLVLKLLHSLAISFMIEYATSHKLLIFHRAGYFCNLSLSHQHERCVSVPKSPITNNRNLYDVEGIAVCQARQIHDLQAYRLTTKSEVWIGHLEKEISPVGVQGLRSGDPLPCLPLGGLHRIGHRRPQLPSESRGVPFPPFPQSLWERPQSFQTGRPNV